MVVCLRLRQTTGGEVAVNGQSTLNVQDVHIKCFIKKKRSSMISFFKNMKIWY